MASDRKIADQKYRKGRRRENYIKIMIRRATHAKLKQLANEGESMFGIESNSTFDETIMKLIEYIEAMGYYDEDSEDIIHLTGPCVPSK